MPKDEDYTTVLQLLPQTAVESVWLGALLTIHFSGGEVAKEARRLLDGLEALRANTLDASAKPESLSRTAAKGMATFNDVDALQQALIHENKIKILYKDKSGHPTERVVWPLNTEHYGPKGAMLCWCEKRQDFRHFRFDRLQQLVVLPDKSGAPRHVMSIFAQIIMPDDFE
jgi:predicted DNA-binding transcriptional regulator YafY